MAIVCGTDFGEAATVAADAAAALAAKSAEPLFLVHALELPNVAFIAGEGIIVPPSVPPPDNEELRLELELRLANEARRLGHGVIPVLAIGTPHEVLREEAERRAARMIVVGTHGPGRVTRWLLGSTADRLARTVHVPLLVVRCAARGLADWAAESGRPLRVLACVDFEDAKDSVLAVAASLREAGDCELHVVHSIERPSLPWTPSGPLNPATQWAEIEGKVRQELERLAARGVEGGAPAGVHLVNGKPAHTISRLAEDIAADVVVAGTHGRHGLERVLLGSVALGILHRTACPVLVVPIVETPVHAPSPAP